MRTAVPVGRALFALIFIVSSFGLFAGGPVAHAESAGVPLASLAVPVAGIIALVGGLMILVGFHARIGGWLLVLFLVSVTLFMHRFWAVDDPQQAMLERISFLKNLALIGGALLVAYWGAGPVSIDERRAHAAPPQVREPLPT